MSKPLHEIMAQLLSGGKLEEDNVVGKQDTTIKVDRDIKDPNQELVDTANIIKSAPLVKDPNKKEEIDDADVDGIADGILVVTDPEIASEEFEEVADELQGIVDNTEAGELPFTDKYEGDYILSCPICGGTFVNDTLLESGEDTCPICCKVPDAFVVNGKIENQETAVEQDDIQEEIEHEENLEEPIEEMPLEEPIEEEPLEEPAKKESKAVEGNKLQESKLEEDEYDDYIENEKALSADYCERAKKSITQEARVAFADLKDILDTEANDTSVDGFYFPSKAVAVLSNTDKRHNLNNHMDLTISNILNMVDDNETIEGAIEELFAEYKADSALSWADNFITVLGKLDFDVIDDEKLEELDEGKLVESWTEKDFSDDIDKVLMDLLANIYEENGISTGDITPEQSDELDNIISSANKLFNSLCKGNTPLEESKKLTEGDDTTEATEIFTNGLDKAVQTQETVNAECMDEMLQNANGILKEVADEQGVLLEGKEKKEEYIETGFSGDPFDKHDFEDLMELDAYIKDHGYELLSDEHIDPNATTVEVFDPAGNDGEVYVFDIEETEKGVTIEMNHKDSFNMNESKKIEEAVDPFEYTENIEDAKKFKSSKSAENYIEKHWGLAKNKDTYSKTISFQDGDSWYIGFTNNKIKDDPEVYLKGLKKTEGKLEESEIKYDYFDSDEMSDLGSDAEIVEALFLELGMEVDETWDNVGEAIDNEYLKVATINGKSYIVYDDGTRKGYSLGRANDNMPIVKTGDIEKELLKEEIVVSGTDEQIEQAREDSIEKGLCAEEKLVEEKVVWDSEHDYVVDPENEDFKEWFEMNGYDEYLEDVEDEDERAAIINDYLEMYNETDNEIIIEDWQENILPLLEKQLDENDLMIMLGSAQTWRGTHDAGKILRGIDDFQSLVADYDEIRLLINDEGGLAIELVHHDGTHRMDLYTFNGDTEGVYNKLIDLGMNEFADDYEDFNDASSYYDAGDFLEYLLDGYQAEMKEFLVPLKWNI